MYNTFNNEIIINIFNILMICTSYLTIFNILFIKTLKIMRAIITIFDNRVLSIYR